MEWLLDTDLEKISHCPKWSRKKEKPWSKNEREQLEKGIPVFHFFIFGILNWYQAIQH